MFELGALLQLLPAVALFISQHWDSIVAVCTALVVAFQAVKSKEYAKLWPAVLVMVRDVAGKELSGVEKRKEVVAGIREAMPAWLKLVVSEQEMEELAEKAYLFLRGELKQDNQT